MAQKLMTILIKVEPPAFGPVILKLKEMPGIVEFNFDVSDSKATKEADPITTGPRINAEQIVMAMLMKGPVHIDDVQRAFVGAGLNPKRNAAHGAMYQLRKKGIAKAIGTGTIELTAKARKSINGHEADAIKLLPKPRAAATNGRLPEGRKRQSPGAGQKVMLAMLAQGPAKAEEIGQRLEAHQMSASSRSGILDRAKRDGLVKSDGKGTYELTAKGRTTAEAAHG
jgi:hypothetical protein